MDGADFPIEARFLTVGAIFIGALPEKSFSGHHISSVHFTFFSDLQFRDLAFICNIH